MNESQTEVIERMLSRTEKPDSGCWEWQGATSGGYGVVGYQSRQWYTHRLSYSILRGELKDGLQIDHLCSNRKCWNPNHLDQVDCRTNLLRGNTMTAKRAAQTHCMTGHEFTEENVKIRPNGTRYCRACARIRERQRYWDKNPVAKRKRPAVGAGPEPTKADR
jgi:hypothetical protein